MNDTEFARQLKGYRLATAHILYRMPDHPSLLQSFVWQYYDLVPHYPNLRRFLDFWRRDLEGELVSVRVAHREILGPGRYRHVHGIDQLH
jgi:uncharacterized protein Usg